MTNREQVIHRIPDITDVGPTDFNTTLADDVLESTGFPLKRYSVAAPLRFTFWPLRLQNAATLY